MFCSVDSDKYNWNNATKQLIQNYVTTLFKTHFQLQNADLNSCCSV